MSIDKKIFSCPDCGQKMRVPKHKNILFNCTKCNKRISYNDKPNYALYYLCFILIILLLSYLLFFKDYFAYSSVKELRTKATCINYYKEHPNGFFTEEVKFIELDIVRAIELVREFLNTYPNSGSKKEVLKINEELWDKEIKRYSNLLNDKEGFDNESVMFFKELLEYMKDNNMATISLKMEGNVNVKNFEEYDKDIRNELDSLIKKRDNRTVSGNIINIKDKYNEGYISSYERVVINSVEAGFENILNNNFIKIVNGDALEKPLNIKINYNIKNQEKKIFQKYLYPVLWTYNNQKKNNSKRGGFISYLIGVSIDYSFEITLPNGGKSLTFENKTNALDHIKNVSSIKDGYEKMTAQNFNNYGHKILKNFGLLEK